MTFIAGVGYGPGYVPGRVANPLLGGTAPAGNTLTIGLITATQSSPVILGTAPVYSDGVWGLQLPSSILAYQDPLSINAYYTTSTGLTLAASAQVTLPYTAIVNGDYAAILGRAPEQFALSTDELALFNGTATASSLATSIAQSPEAQTDIANLYIAALGRTDDAPSASSLTSFLASGGSLTQIEAALAASPEAQADIAMAYRNELGRAPDMAGAAGYTTYLASGGSLAIVKAELANSSEAQSDIATIYQAELGRAPDPVGEAGFTRSLANGSSLAAIRAGVAATPEAQSDVARLYTSVLGRQPDAAGLAGNSKYLADGGTLAGMRNAFANSQETDSNIKQAGGGSGNLGVKSELQSGIPLADVKTELGELSGGPAPTDPTISNIQITPETIDNSAFAAPPTFLYGILNNDCLYANSGPKTITASYGAGGTVTIAGLTRSDILVFQPYQMNSNGSVPFAPSASGTDTILRPIGGGSIDLVGVPVTSAHLYSFSGH